MEERITAEQTRVLEGAALYNATDDELDEMVAAGQITRRQARAAVGARSPRSKAAYGLQIAHEAQGIRTRAKQEKASTQVNVFVRLPPLNQPRQDDEEKVIVIDVNGRTEP